MLGRAHWKKLSYLLVFLFNHSWEDEGKVWV